MTKHADKGLPGSYTYVTPTGQLLQGSVPRCAPSCHDEAMRTQRFDALVADGPGGRAIVVVPFDPDEAWGSKAVHHVNGTVNGTRVRGTLSPGSAGRSFTPSPPPRGGVGAAAAP